MNLKHNIKNLATRIAQRASASNPAGRVVVLCYHSIHPSSRLATVTPDMFEQHLKFIKERCEIVRLCKLRSLRDDLPRPQIVLTFDDGYIDNHQYAFPLLLKYECPATFFVTTGLVDRNPAVFTVFQQMRRAREDEIQPLDWNHIREMARHGQDFGAHTVTHPNLADIGPAAASAQLRLSKEILEERLGSAVTAMAYPFGRPKRHFTRETQELAAAAGYQQAAALFYRDFRFRDSDFAVPRFLTTGDTVDTLWEKITGRWDWLGYWQENAPLWVTKRISPRKVIPDSAAHDLAAWQESSPSLQDGSRK